MSSTPYRDNASLVLPLWVDRSLPAEPLDEQIIHVAMTLCPRLLSKPSSSISSSSEDDEIRECKMKRQQENNSPPEKKRNCIVRPLKGGLSNELFVVDATDDDGRCDESSSVLVRVHPPGGVGIVNRDVENRITAWLSREGSAPVFYGRFLNGRVEEFYDDFVPLSCHEMAQHAPQIATLMAELHTKDIPEGILPPTTNGEIWSRIESWLSMAIVNKASIDKLVAPHLDEASLLDLEVLRSDLTWLKTELTGQLPKSIDDNPCRRRAINFCREVVFTHGDCQSLNILRNHNGQELRLIDFEYAGRNARAVDIANTFCEYCDMNNLKPKYDVEYPSNEQQDEYLRAYIKKCQLDLANELDAADNWSAWLEAMRHEIGRYTLTSHLGWAVWSMAQNTMSTINFDYITYAKLRMEGYHYFKSIYWGRDCE